MPAGKPSPWLEIRDPRTGKLLFRYNPQTQQIHIKRGDLDAIIDLRDYRPGRKAA